MHLQIFLVLALTVSLAGISYIENVNAAIDINFNSRFFGPSSVLVMNGKSVSKDQGFARSEIRCHRVSVYSCLCCVW